MLQYIFILVDIYFLFRYDMPMVEFSRCWYGGKITLDVQASEDREKGRAFCDLARASFMNEARVARIPTAR